MRAPNGRKLFIVSTLVTSALTLGAGACGAFDGSGDETETTPKSENDSATADRDPNDDGGGEEPDASIDAPPDVVFPPTARVECLTGNRLLLDPPESIGQAPPPPDGGVSFVFGVAAVGNDVFVSVGDVIGGGHGRLYRVRGAGAPWVLFAETERPGHVHVKDGFLFVHHQTVTRFPLGCSTPCTSAERVFSSGLDIDSVFIESATSVYAMPYTGKLFHAKRLQAGWNDEVVPMTEPPNFGRTVTGTSDAVFVGQESSDTIQVLPFDPTQTATTLDAQGKPGTAVIADCKRVYALGYPSLAFEPPSTTGTPIGEGVSLDALAIDEQFVYVSYRSGGIRRYRKDGTNAGPDAGEQIATGKSVWGIHVNRDYLYYSDHGGANSGTVYRQKKK